MAANFSAESLPALVDGASPESGTPLSDFPAHDVDEDNDIFASFVEFFLGEEDRVVRDVVDNVAAAVAAAAAPSPSVSCDVDIPVVFSLA
jgi:hypothetical protein